MACSRYEYVKGYEKEDSILPNVWIVIRVDGKGFHKFSKVHDFNKPNDENGKFVNKIVSGIFTGLEKLYTLLHSTKSYEQCCSNCNGGISRYCYLIRSK